MKWISVKDRLPDTSKFVLTYSADGFYGVEKYLTYLKHWSEDNYRPDAEKCRVLYWMPLPEPPEVAGQGA